MNGVRKTLMTGSTPQWPNYTGGVHGSRQTVNYIHTYILYISARKHMYPGFHTDKSNKVRAGRT